MNWYLIKTQKNHEKSVAERLNKEKQINPNSSLHINCVVPTEKTFYVKDGKRMFRERNSYDGYVFIETNSCGEVRQLLRGITGAIGFVEIDRGVPQVLRDSDVSAFKSRMEEKVEDQFKFSVGEIVKITEGAFSDFKGSIETLDEALQKVVVSVSIFGKPTKVDLNILHIEKYNEKNEK